VRTCAHVLDSRNWEGIHRKRRVQCAQCHLGARSCLTFSSSGQHGCAGGARWSVAMSWNAMVAGCPSSGSMGSTGAREAAVHAALW